MGELGTKRVDRIEGVRWFRGGDADKTIPGGQHPFAKGQRFKGFDFEPGAANHGIQGDIHGGIKLFHFVQYSQQPKRARVVLDLVADGTCGDELRPFGQFRPGAQGPHQAAERVDIPGVAAADVAYRWLLPSAGGHGAFRRNEADGFHPRQPQRLEVPLLLVLDGHHDVRPAEAPGFLGDAGVEPFRPHARLDGPKMAVAEHVVGVDQLEHVIGQGFQHRRKPHVVHHHGLIAPAAMQLGDQLAGPRIVPIVDGVMVAEAPLGVGQIAGNRIEVVPGLGHLPALAVAQPLQRVVEEMHPVTQRLQAAPEAEDARAVALERGMAGDGGDDQAVLGHWA